MFEACTILIFSFSSFTLKCKKKFNVLHVILNEREKSL